MRHGEDEEKNRGEKGARRGVNEEDKREKEKEEHSESIKSLETPA
jgi:hypothetical protein